MGRNMDDNPDSADSELGQRIKALLARPAEEWLAIAAERDSSTATLRHYVLPLALIAPVCTFLGGQLIGYGGMRPPIPVALLGIALDFIQTIVILFVLAAIVNVLTPPFGGKADSTRAFRLVAFSATPALLTGAFGLVPPLSFLMVLALYSFFVFHTGITTMLRVPEDKANIFTGTAFLASVLTSMLIAGAFSMGRMVLAGFL
jgi:hypothetical protein